jgi:hypothetical protein
MALIAAQLLYFSRLGVQEGLWNLVPGMLLGGVGMAAVMAPATAAALAGVSVDKMGVGSAVLNSSRQLGGSTGMALMGAIMVHEIGGQQSPEAFVHGFPVSLKFAAAIAMAGALVALVTLRAHVRRGCPGVARSSDATWGGAASHSSPLTRGLAVSAQARARA